MSRFKDLIADIQDDILDGLMSFEEIALKWNCPVSWVESAEELLEDDSDYGEMKTNKMNTFY